MRDGDIILTAPILSESGGPCCLEDWSKKEKARSASFYLLFIFSSSSLHLLFIFSSSSKKWVENGVGKQYKFRIVGIGGLAAALKYLNIKI